MVFNMQDKLICGDSISILKTIETGTIHAIISDIPYGIGYDEWDVMHNNTNSAYGGCSRAQNIAGDIFKRRGKPLNGWSNADRNISKEYFSWCSSWADDWLRVLKPGASCFIFAGRRYAHQCIAALENSGFTFKDMLAWEKHSAAHRAQHLSSIYKRRNDIFNETLWEGWRVANIRPLFEPILWFQKPYKIGTTIADNVLEHCVGAWNERALNQYNSHEPAAKKFSNILKVEFSAEDHGKHIAQKPVMLMELLISLVTLENQIILDPFMGSGTTCVAAKKLHRHYIGIDIDEKCVDTASIRLKQLSSSRPQLTLFGKTAIS